MKNIHTRTLRKLREMQIFGLLLVGFSSITAMDEDNMFDMYDASDSSDDSSSSFDVSYSSPSSVKYDFDKTSYGILHKKVDHSIKYDNHALLNFYDEDDRKLSDEDIRNFDKKNQRLKRRLEEMGSVIEGTRKNGKSELFELLPKDDVAKYDVGIDAEVNPKTRKIEFNSHINVLLNSKNSDIDDDKIIANVDKIEKDLKRYYNIKIVNYEIRKEVE